ncbi:hypothetical protein R6Q59_008964 [Mikania micrantha]
MARTRWLTERVVVTISEPRKQERQSTAVIHKNRFVLRHFHSIFFTERLPLSPLLSRYAQMEPGGKGSVFFYGVGHVLNDITAACWFAYLLVFMTDIELSPRDAATVMLSGQIADGFTTIFAGELVKLQFTSTTATHIQTSSSQNQQPQLQQLCTKH